MGIDPLNKIYVVDHIREYYQDPKNPEKKYLDSKGIGNFYSLEKAKEIVNEYKNLKGFKDYPNGFKITEYTIDSIYNSFINKLINIYSKKNNKKLSKVFCLYYVLENEDDSEDIELLGLFSSEQKACDARKRILKQTTLRHLASNFQIFEEFVDKMNWEEGFITWEQSLRMNRGVCLELENYRLNVLFPATCESHKFIYYLIVRDL